MSSLADEQELAVDPGSTPQQRTLGVRQIGYARHPAIWIGAVDLILILVFGFASPGHVFFNAGNFTNMARDASQLVLLAGGFCLLLAAGELDISIGANVILSSVLGGKVILSVAGTSDQEVAGQYPHFTTAVILGFMTCVVVGVLFGLVNGLIVTRLGVNSFVTTLGTLGIGTGLALVFTGGNDLVSIPPSLQSDFGVYNVAGYIPAAAIVTAVIVLLLYLVLRTTRFGIHIVALGSSRQAAVRAGLRTKREVTILFVLMGFLAGIGGIMDVCRFATTDLSGHQTDALQAIAGVIIGGASLYGGRVSIPGAVFGTLLSVILETGLVIQGLSPFYQQVIVGSVLIAAVALRANLVKREEASG
jgi:ribose transport system permease protein